MDKPQNPIHKQMDNVRAQGLKIDEMSPEEIFSIGCVEGATLARELLDEVLGRKNMPLKFLDGIGMYLVAAGSLACEPEDVGGLAAAHIASMMRFCIENGHELPEHLTRPFGIPTVEH